MSIPVVKFNNEDRPEFFKTVNTRVNAYFKENNISRHANLNMKFKTVFMISLYFVPFVLMLTGVITSYWGAFAMWSIMGLGVSGIGLSIMHDANHGSYSKNASTNKLFGFILNFVGGYHVNWKIQHNVLHHSFTNIEGWDEDIEKGIKDMIAKISKAGARVILCTPTMIGEKNDGSNPDDKMLDQYSDISRKVAKETKSQLLDFRKIFLTQLKKHNPENATKGIFTSDGVHMNERGNRLLSRFVLKELQVKTPQLEKKN